MNDSSRFGGSVRSLGASEVIAEEPDENQETEGGPARTVSLTLPQPTRSPNRVRAGGSRVGAAKRQFVERSKWLSSSPKCGYVRVFQCQARSGQYGGSVLLPCQLDTTAAKLGRQLAQPNRQADSLAPSAAAVLYLETPDGRLRRLAPNECPLGLQDSLLALLGHSEAGLRQWLGAGTDAPYLMRFHAGRPVWAVAAGAAAPAAGTALQEVLLTRRGRQWRRRLCECDVARLVVFRDVEGTSLKETIFLAGGAVCRLPSKSSSGKKAPHRLEIRGCGEKPKQGLQLAFTDESVMLEWLQHLQLASSQSAAAAELSGRHFELVPESLFRLVDHLKELNLRRNCLISRLTTPESSLTQRGSRVTGYLDDLQRFRHLTYLDLSENFLTSLPACLCRLRTLTVLNIAANQIAKLPAEIANLKKLESLHAYNNRLTELPEAMSALTCLAVLLIAFNRFVDLPPVLASLPSNRDVIMPGNQLSGISEALATRMDSGSVRRMNLRFNHLALDNSSSQGLDRLKQLVYLDLRDNLIESLDLQSLSSLEFLSCDRNRLTEVRLNGTALRTLLLPDNKLQAIQISPAPYRLECLDVSDNRLASLPDCLWPEAASSLVRCLASGNEIRRLPADIWRCRRLQTLRMDRNRLTALPTPPHDADCLDELRDLSLHSNRLTSLPGVLFRLAPSLLSLNVANNLLTELPQRPQEMSSNIRLRVLTASFNQLRDEAVPLVAAGFGMSLRVLKLAFNRLNRIDEDSISSLVELQELNVSGNQLQSLPATLRRLNQLVSIRAHSNCLQRLPDLSAMPSLRILDVGCNMELSGSVRGLMESKLSYLDLSCNHQMGMSVQDLASMRSSSPIHTVDASSAASPLFLPLLQPQRSVSRISCSSMSSVRSVGPFQFGLSEAAGSSWARRHLISVSVVKRMPYPTPDAGLFAMFDGDGDAAMARRLQADFCRAFKSELRAVSAAAAASAAASSAASAAPEARALRRALLTCHRRLRGLGRRRGAAGAALHLKRLLGHWQITTANAGDVEVLLVQRSASTGVAADATARRLTRCFLAQRDRDEANRVARAGGIVTNDGRINGQCRCTRMLGWSSLHPIVVPDPQVTQINLTEADDALVVANRGLWSFVGHKEVAAEMAQISHPVAAAKRLVDLAQAYGSTENVCVLVLKIRPELLAKPPALTDEDYAEMAPSSSVFSFDSDQSEDAPSSRQRDRLAHGMRRRLVREVKSQELDTDLSDVFNSSFSIAESVDGWTWQRGQDRRTGVGAGMSGLMLHAHASLTASDVDDYRRRLQGGVSGENWEDSDLEYDYWDSLISYVTTGMNSRRSSVPSSVGGGASNLSEMKTFSSSAAAAAVDSVDESKSTTHISEAGSRAASKPATNSAAATLTAPADPVFRLRGLLVDTGTEPELPGCDFRLSVQLPVPSTATVGAAAADEDTWL